MAGSPYEWNVVLSGGGALDLSATWVMTDGSPFPWTDYAVEYALGGELGGEIVRLSGPQIAVNPITGVVTFASPTTSLRPGRYVHAGRAIHLSTGKAVPMFDGTVTVAESALCGAVAVASPTMTSPGDAGTLADGIVAASDAGVL